ncbi:hypothetical protein [Aestuariicoccus sp. MJ-SS9]|nr:hypothetical protein [Aestuariicoccus sp. MJ-SS9]MDU8913174.1 hypothetical protein [Aestuariicoccus sp. MJ-SS9]
MIFIANLPFLNSTMVAQMEHMSIFAYDAEYPARPRVAGSAMRDLTGCLS